MRVVRFCKYLWLALLILLVVLAGLTLKNETIESTTDAFRPRERQTSTVGTLEANKKPYHRIRGTDTARALAHFTSQVNVERFIQATPPEARHCRMDTCFSYSRCSLFSAFPVFFYTDKDHSSSSSVSLGVSDSLLNAVSENVLRTLDAERACVHVLIFDSRGAIVPSPAELQAFLRSLPSWKGEGVEGVGGRGGGGFQEGGGGKGPGSNHVLVNLATSGGGDNSISNNLFEGVDVGQAIVVQSSLTTSTDTTATTTAPFRPDFDIVIPSYSVEDAVAGSPELPPMFPARRKYLLSFVGVYTPSSPSEAAVARGKFLSALLEDLQGKSPSELKIDLSCGILQGGGGGKANNEWRLCGDAKQRAGVLAQSTFALLVAPLEETQTSTLSFQTRLYEALKNGAAPVILGDQVRVQEVMPFRELLRWEESTFTLPMGQASELLPFLMAFGDGDIAQLRFKGRNLWENYFSSPRRIVDMTLAVVRSRLQIPALPARREPAVTFFNASFVNKTGVERTLGPQGPLGPLFASDEFQSMFSRTAMLDSFNRPGGDPFSLFPHTPFEPVLPTAANLWGAQYGLHPVGQKEPGLNKQFSPVLGGNWPQEQFTVMILTYNRTLSLMASLRRLRNLPFLNKVIVVWNDPSPPDRTIKWPQLHVPVEVLKQRTNSLNNRFLPFDNIQTECILSLDDDAVISKEKIIAGFRVWREERDRLVGYFPRCHRWDATVSRFLYTTQTYPREESIIFTSASFFHAYYLYLYSYVMPRAVYDHIQNKMNCEDIAMNFLVSHVTRKPNILVNNTWVPNCPNCGISLSVGADHLKERQECMKVFTRAWGYMPLLYTTHRVDNVPVKDPFEDPLRVFGCKSEKDRGWEGIILIERENEGYGR